MSSKMCNIHDYLEAIGAEPPPVDEKKVAEIKKEMIICNSFEEVADVLEGLDFIDKE